MLLHRTLRLAVPALALVAGQAAAQPLVVDQQNALGGGTNSVAYTGAGQSFTPTFSAIDAATFRLRTGGAAAELQLRLYEGAGTSGALLGSSAPQSVATNGFEDVYFALLAPATLTPGSLYTLFVQALMGDFGQEFSADDPYAGGDAYDQNGVAASGVDLVFSEGVYAPPLIVDQENTVGGETNSVAFTGAGQAFTPTFSAIDAATFRLSTGGSAATLQLELYEGAGTLGALLGASGPRSVATSGFEQVDFNLASRVSLTPGSPYTLFVRALNGVFGQEFSAGDPYTGGDAYDQNGFVAQGVDLVFAEGVTSPVSAVPEPGTLGLLGAGLAALGGLGARTRRRPS